MELAAAQGFDIRVVSLPPGSDPADDASGFEARLAAAEDYLPYRIRVEIERMLPDRQRAFERVREVLAPFRDSPERQDAVRLAAGPRGGGDSPPVPHRGGDRAHVARPPARVRTRARSTGAVPGLA